MIKTILFLLLVSTALPGISAVYEDVRFIKNHDGDTFTAFVPSKEKRISVRLAWVDCPELKQPYGPLAKKYLQKILENKSIQLNCISKSYTREVCHVFVEKRGISKDVAILLTRAGLAWDVKKYSSGYYLIHQSFAEKKKRGLWSQKDPVRPSDFRKLK